MNLNQLHKLIEVRRAELVKLENAAEVLAALNGTISRKLTKMDEHAMHLSTVPSNVALVPKRRGRPPGPAKPVVQPKQWTLSAKARKRISEQRKAWWKRQKAAQRAPKNAQPADNNIVLKFEMPRELATHWQFNKTMSKAAKKKVALAVVRYLSEAGAPTDKATVVAVIKRLGWTYHPGMIGQMYRWKSATDVKRNGEKERQLALTAAGMERLAAVEARASKASA